MEIQYYKYNFPFKKAFITASGHIKDRRGIIIELQKNEIRALGEAAPLPGFSSECLSDLKVQIQQHKKDISQFFLDPFTLKSTREFIYSHTFSPSLEFAFFTLAAAYLAQERQSSLQRLLARNSNKNVSINAVIGSDLQNFNERIAEFSRQDYQTVKIKTGSNWQELYSSLQTMRAKYPQLVIRLDANQSWTFEEASRNLCQMAGLDIEYCEEPLAQPTPEAIKKLSREAPVPIALDESLAGCFQLHEALGLAQVIVIKPTVLGITFLSDDFQAHAEKNNTKLVFTTSLEAAIGRLMTASLASKMGAFETAHGLSTGSLLNKDIWHDDEFIQNGRFHLPDDETLSKLMNTNFTSDSIKKLFD